MKIKTVTVLGASGEMGSNISGIFSSFGNAKVFMVSRSIEKSKKAIIKAAESVKADSVLKNLIASDYSMLKQCIEESDLIFESVSEDINIKIEITKKIAKHLKENSIYCTGTSGLSVTILAEALPKNLRKNYIGIHMYNPPYNLVLCEIISTKYSSRDIIKNVKNYMSRILYRTIVEVKDSPGFLGNRIGFHFINDALQYAEKYKHNGGIDYIDSILGQFSGRSMPPLVTSDFVGLDIHKAIVKNIFQKTNDYARDTFIMPDFAKNLVIAGKLGRKTGEGLYKIKLLDNGIKSYMVYDIATNEYREKINFVFPFSDNMVEYFADGDYKHAFKSLINNRSIEAEICLEFLLKYVIYSLNSINLVGYNIHSADDVMADGYNWCPPLAMIEALFGIKNFKLLAKERLNRNIINAIDLDKLLRNVKNSKYDYRRYFKAKK